MNSKALLALLALLMVGINGCSNMAVDNTDDETIPSLPADFDAKLYLDMNPDVVAPLLQDSASRYNASLSYDPLTAFAEKVTDDSAFIQDSLTVRWIVRRFKVDSLLVDTNVISNLMNSSANLGRQFLCGSKMCFNFRKTSTDTVIYKEILTGLDSVAYGSYNYRYAGRFDGHPYKYCDANKGPARSTIDTAQAIEIKLATSSVYNFSRFTYCLNSTDNQIYMSKKKEAF